MKNDPVLDCPCDETSVENGGNNPNGTGTSGSDPDGPDGDSTGSDGGGGNSGGPQICVMIIVIPCTCVGHSDPADCSCSIQPSEVRIEYNCALKSMQKVEGANKMSMAIVLKIVGMWE